MKRVQVEQAKPRQRGATQRALKAGPAGKATNTAGSRHSEPNPHHGREGKHHAKIG